MAEQANLRRLGRKRKEGKRPQRKPPACDTCEVPAGVVATVTMKKPRKASIMMPRMNGLAGHGCRVIIHTTARLSAATMHSTLWFWQMHRSSKSTYCTEALPLSTRDKSPRYMRHKIYKDRVMGRAPFY